MQKIKNDLEMDLMILHKWFHENHMVLNLGKCRYIVVGDDDPTQKIILNNNKSASSNEEKLLGILLESELNFDSHITSLCKKAGQKLSALARISHSLSQDQKLLLLNSVVKSQFSDHCPLLPTDLDVFFSIFKQCIKQHSRKSLTSDLQGLRATF